MKYLLSAVLLNLFIFTHAQVVSVTATYTGGDKGLDGQGAGVTIASVSGCPATLNVPVPAGRFVVGIDVEYDLQSLGTNFWQSEQRSYLECVTTGNKEAALSSGPPINTGGIVSYARNNLTIANGLVGAGGNLEFKLHGLRTFGTGCNITQAKIMNGTFKITVWHIPPPTCFQPSNLTSSAPSQNSILLDWTSGGATNWELEYGAPGFTPGTGTRVSVTSKPFLLNSLSPSSNYEFVVRDSCGLGDVSIWSAPVNFRTSCAAVTAPFFENFDGADWNVSGFGSKGTIDTCWTRNYTDGFTWVKGLPPFVNNFTGPSADHTTGSGKYIYTDFVLFSPAPLTARIQTPEVNVNPLTTPQLSFWYHAFGTAIGALNVEVSTNSGATFTSVFTLNGQQQTQKSDPWREAIVDLSSFANTTLIVRFTITQTVLSSSSEFALDDVRIEEAPSCPRPQNYVLNNTWIDGASLGFTSVNASNWQFEYGPTGYTFGSGTRMMSATNPTQLTGLTPATTYDVYMRSVCGTGDSSLWVGPVTFTTYCTPVASPYTQNFDNANFVPGTGFNVPGTIDNCYRRDNIVNYIFKAGPSTTNLFATGPAVDHTNGTASGKYLMADAISFNASDFDATVHTVPIDISNLTAPQFSFWEHMFGADISRLEVSAITENGTTPLLTISGQQQTSKTDAWKEHIIALSSLTEDTVVIAFKAVRASTTINARIAIDDLQMIEAPSCPKPQLLTVVGNAANAITLSWMSGGAANWQVEYGAPGFTPGTGTLVNVNSNPTIISGLTANTNYQFRVRDSCGAGDVSAWSNTVGARTTCLPALAPFFENFDGTDFTVGTITVTSGIDPCWSRDTAVRYSWEVGGTGTANFSTGPTNDHTTGSGKYLYTGRFFATGIAQNRETFLESPSISCVPLTTPELQFWYHMFGDDIDSLGVDVFDGTSWTRVWGVASEQQTSGTADWLEANIDLSTYTNDTIKVRFRGYSESTFSFAHNIAIDDFHVRETPSCPKPSNLVATASTGNSVTLSWTSGGASNWIIEYGIPGFTKGTGVFVAANSNPFTVTGLGGSTSYEFYVRDSCGLSDVSDWSVSAIGNTDCVPLVAPYFENFESGAFMRPTTTLVTDSGSFPVCWHRNINLSYFWVIGPPNFSSTFTGPSGDHTSGNGKYAFAESAFGGTSPFITEITTPPIDLTALTVPELSFWYHKFGAGVGLLTVYVSSGNGPFTIETTIAGQTQTSPGAAWLEEIVDLSAYAGDTIRVKFRAQKNTTTTAADMAIDDIDIHEAPSCPKPSALQTLTVTPNAVQLGWTSGGASSWEIEYGPVGFSPGSGTIVTTGTQPFFVPGLSSNTGYDFYVRDVCGTNDKSDWFGPHSDTTACSIFTVPYTEDFESNAWDPGTFVNDPGTISPCFDRVATNGYFWKANRGPTTSFNTGPDGDHTTGNGKYMVTEGFGTTTTNNVITLELPIFDISPLTAPQMRFWYHMFGGNIQSLKVEGWNAVTLSWQQLSVLNGAQHSSNAAPWSEGIVNLGVLPRDTIALRFVATRLGTGTLNDIAVDDIWIGETPSCARPTNFAVVSSTTNSINVSWNSGGAANSLIKYRLSGSTGPFTFQAVSGTSTTITGLQPASLYDIYLADSCGAGDISLYVGPVQGATACGVRSLPYSENFNGGFWQTGTGFFNTGDVVSPCWTRASTTANRWGSRTGATSNAQSGPSGGVSGGYLYAISTTGGVQAIDIESESIAIPSAANSPKLYFYYHMFGTDIDSFGIQVKTGASWSGNIWSKAGAQHSAKASPWTRDSVDLSNYLGETLKFRLMAYTKGFASNIAVDEMQIIEKPLPCNAPVGLSITAVGSTVATVNWTSGSGTSNVVVTLAGQPLATGTTYSGVSSPFNLTSLLPNTAYDVYVQDDCGGGSLSNYANGNFTTTACQTVTAGLTITSSGLTGTFDASTTTNADSIYLDYGDGNNTNAQNSTNTYGAAGTYVISLYAYNNCGNADTLYDTLKVCPPLVNAFTYTQNNSTFDFDASGSTGAIGYNWDFGDGSTGAGATINYVYASVGTFTVTLEVYNQCGDTLTSTQTVAVCIKPFAKWTYNIISSGGGGMLVQFDGTGSLNAVNYEWSFGDGNTLSGVAAPQHTYLVPSLNYTVRLIVYNNCGGSDTMSYKLNQISLDETVLDALIQVYPVPATDILSISYDHTVVDVQQLELVDVSGRTLKVIELNHQREVQSISVQDLAPNLYLLKIHTDEGVLVKKIKIVR
jgi:hypothetical protein